MTGGIIQQRKVGRGVDLLLPEDSLLREQIDTVGRSFPYWMRENSMIIVHSDLIDTGTIRAMAAFDEK